MIEILGRKGGAKMLQRALNAPKSKIDCEKYFDYDVIEITWHGYSKLITRVFYGDMFREQAKKWPGNGFGEQ